MKIILPLIFVLLNTNSTYSRVDYFDKSNINIMYNEDSLDTLNKYQVDNITWGGHIHYYRSSYNETKSFFEKYIENELNLYSIDIALIQEGGIYAVCAGNWNSSCQHLYYSLNDKSMSEVELLLKSNLNVYNRCVVDFDGKVQGVPWLYAQNRLLPMACVNDPGYKEWLFKKIEYALQAKPNTIHFDEPLMEAVTVGGDSGSFSWFCTNEFNEYLQENPKLFAKHGIPFTTDFNYKEFIAKESKGEVEKYPLWKEYEQFRIDSTVKLFKELVEHTRKKSNYPINISINASPANWKTIPLIKEIDFLSSEVSHEAKNIQTSFAPIIRYKMADALEVDLISTALGRDWDIIKKSKHDMLACSWIAQAYAFGHFMNFPVKAWIYKSSYTPNSDKYSILAKWIKGNSKLFDNFETMSNFILPVDMSTLRSYNKMHKFESLIRILTDNNFLFDISIIDNHLHNYKLPTDINNSNKNILIVSDFLSNETISKFDKLYSNNVVKFNFNSISNDINILDNLSNIKTDNNILCIPRENKNNQSIVLHVLNRRYDSANKDMNIRHDVEIKIEKKMLPNYKNITELIYRQPNLTAYKSDRTLENVDEMIEKVEKITVTEDKDKYVFQISNLHLWGLIEFDFDENIDKPDKFIFTK